MKIELLKSRIDKLAGQMQSGDLAVIFANELPAMPVPFLQDKNFVYFTGLEIPKAIFVLQKVKEKAVPTLFIERGIPEREVWEGKKMTLAAAQELTGIESVQYLDLFRSHISAKLASVSRLIVNTNYTHMDDALDRRGNFVRKARERFIQLDCLSLNKLMPQLRMEKDAWEIEQLSHAIELTAKGIKRIYREAKAGMNEAELEAILRFEAVANQAKHLGFSPIIASGENATTLHYENNNCEIGENDLVLLDVGAAWNNYSADISRTFPVAGKFSARQKEVYAAVLAVQKEIIALIKPGVTMQELNSKTIELISQALKDLGLIQDDSEIKKYYMHSIGHHLGLDTHDLADRAKPLSPGCVITIEPGIYIKAEKIGVRIEDDILVTETGYRNLSESIPKEIADLEELCK
ncbi:MAG: aminopeptidase P family protein [Candidatus Cloacimonadales bacterium]